MPLYLRFVKRRGRLRRPAAERLPRDAAGEHGHRRRSASGCDQASVLGMLEDLAEANAAEGKVRRRSGRSSARCSRKAWARTTPTRSGSPSCCASPRRTPTATTQTVSLADYIGRMKEGQEEIYYVTADTFAAAKNSPHLEIFRKKGIEVLLLSDRVDEWMVGHLTEFDGKPLQSRGQGRPRPGQAGGRGREEGSRRRPPTSSRTCSRRCKAALGDARQGRARHAPPDRFAGLPGGGRARHARQPGAHAQGGRAEGAGHRSRSSKSTRSTRW